MFITMLIINNSCAVLVNASLLSLTFAQALIPYVGMPSCANMEKYVIRDVAKETLPVPIGNKILETYGNVINGKINCDMVKIAFIMKLSLNDLCLFIFQ